MTETPSQATKKPKANWPILSLVVWLAVTFAAAGIGAAASMDAAGFYSQLSLPQWAPPAAVFGPVWSVLYLLIGIAAWVVWKHRGWCGAPLTLGLFLFQLAANAAWTWLFFAWHLGAIASLEILVLWLLIVATVIAFWRVRPIAGILLLPYLAWVTFACGLSWSIWRNNPLLLG